MASGELGGMTALAAKVSVESLAPRHVVTASMVTSVRGHLQEHLFEGCYTHAVAEILRGGQWVHTCDQVVCFIFGYWP